MYSAQSEIICANQKPKQLDFFSSVDKNPCSFNDFFQESSFALKDKRDLKSDNINSPVRRNLIKSFGSSKEMLNDFKALAVNDLQKEIKCSQQNIAKIVTNKSNEKWIIQQQTPQRFQSKKHILNVLTPNRNEFIDMKEAAIIQNRIRKSFASPQKQLQKLQKQLFDRKNSQKLQQSPLSKSNESQKRRLSLLTSLRQNSGSKQDKQHQKTQKKLIENKKLLIQDQLRIKNMEIQITESKIKHSEQKESNQFLKKKENKEEEINLKQNQQVEDPKNNDVKSHSPPLIEQIKSQIINEEYIKEEKKQQNQTEDAGNQSNANFSFQSVGDTEREALFDCVEQELCCNGLGMYQSALSSLRALIEEFPRATPLLKVLRKVLEDRHASENRKKEQQQRINELKAKIKKQTKLQQKMRLNRKQIFDLLRRVSD